MFRKARRLKQMLTCEESLKMLSKGSSGILSLLGDNDYTYGVPLTYTYDDGKLYFHSAAMGHKIDAIQKHNKVSFTVIVEDNVDVERTSTWYKSLIAFGKVRFAESDEEKRQALILLGKRFSPQRTENLSGIIEKKLNMTQIIIMEIEHLTGKEAIEYTMARKRNNK